MSRMSWGSWDHFFRKSKLFSENQNVCHACHVGHMGQLGPKIPAFNIWACHVCHACHGDLKPNLFENQNACHIGPKIPEFHVVFSQSSQNNIAKGKRHWTSQECCMSCLMSKFHEKLPLKPLFLLILRSSQPFSQLERGALGIILTYFTQI